MTQVIFTLEAIETMGIEHTTLVAISKLKSGQEDWRSVVFVEGISNVQIADILKAILLGVDTAFEIFTRVPLEHIHELTGDNEVEITYLDAKLN